MKEYERLHQANPEALWTIRADRQSQGFGRGLNQWHSSLGGLWFSFDMVETRMLESFALYVGACVHKVLLKHFPVLEDKLLIKWPNDIYYGDRKLAGILTRYSTSESRYIIGIGINTNNRLEEQSLEQTAAILGDILEDSVSNSFLMAFIIDQIQTDSVVLDNPCSYLDYCDNNLYGKGRQAAVTGETNTHRGKIVGLDPFGAIILEDEAGKQTVHRFGSLLVEKS